MYDMLFWLLTALHPDNSLANKRGTERDVRETAVNIQYLIVEEVFHDHWQDCVFFLQFL